MVIPIMKKLPPTRLGAPRRADRLVDDHSSVSVHLSLPGWLVRELYGVAHSEHRSVSSVAALALTDGRALEIWVSDGDPVWTSLATSSIALLVTWISLGAKTFRFADEAEAHRDIASRLWDVRESYISLISDLMSGDLSDNQARGRRDELQEAARAAYADAPRTSAKAFTRAQEGLKHNEEMTFTPREIDLFLPEALRLGGGEAQP